MTETQDLNTIERAAEIAAAYVSHNALSPTDLPTLIKSVHGALAALGSTVVAAEPEEPSTPAVSIKKSVSPEALICLVCGKTFKSIKRHLQTSHSLTPDQYRARWNLPSDYPMVAPAYSASRSALAKSFGLGVKRKGRR